MSEQKLCGISNKIYLGRIILQNDLYLILQLISKIILNINFITRSDLRSFEMAFLDEWWCQKEKYVPTITMHNRK